MQRNHYRTLILGPQPAAIGAKDSKVLSSLAFLGSPYLDGRTDGQTEGVQMTQNYSHEPRSRGVRLWMEFFSRRHSQRQRWVMSTKTFYEGRREVPT